MSGRFGGENDLLQLVTMCKELRKEKDILRESLLLEQSRSGDMIRKMEADVNALSEVHIKDKNYIEKLETELRNSSLKIAYLQDQLNLRNVEANCVGEHVHSLELKLAETNKLYHKLNLLRDELVKSDSERFFLMRELERKEEELQNSSLCIEKLETTISSIALESQCEIESLRLDLEASEKRLFNANTFHEQASNETARMAALMTQYEERFQEAQEMINYLGTENKTLHDKLMTSEKNTVLFCRKIEEHLDEWLKNNRKIAVHSKLENGISAAKNIFPDEVLSPLFTKLAAVTNWDEKFKDDMENMSHQICASELLVKQLKDELREEKLKAKEEAEDLTQEMAELRFQITDMLEEECKRRAYIEKASLHRIKELEAEVQKERRKSLIVSKHLLESDELAKAKSVEEVKDVNYNLVGLLPRVTSTTCSCGECIFSENPLDLIS